MARNTVIPEETVEESIETYTVARHSFTITVNVRQLKDVTLYNTRGVMYIEKQIDYDKPAIRVTIANNYYRALMSEHPPWNSQKAEGQFGQEDIWTCIDAIRSKTRLAIGTETDISKGRL